MCVDIKGVENSVENVKTSAKPVIMRFAEVESVPETRLCSRDYFVLVSKNRAVMPKSGF